MKVPYAEDIANHSSPESCGGYGNVSAEALTGGSVGKPLSSEITFFRVPTPCTEGEGHLNSSVICELLDDPAESENLACVDTSYAIVTNQEIREKPYMYKLEWGNPDDKNLPVHRRAFLFEKQKRGQARNRQKKDGSR